MVGRHICILQTKPTRSELLSPSKEIHNLSNIEPALRVHRSIVRAGNHRIPSLYSDFFISCYPPWRTVIDMDLLSKSTAQWQELLTNGQLSARELVERCLEQIEKHNHNGMCLNAVLHTMPSDIALRRAAQLGKERALGRLRSPLHGILTRPLQVVSKRQSNMGCRYREARALKSNER